MSRFIQSSTMPPGGVQQVRHQIQTLQLSLSLLEDQLARLESQRNLEETIATIQTSINGTQGLLQRQQKILATHEQHESNLQAVQLIQEIIDSL